MDVTINVVLMAIVYAIIMPMIAMLGWFFYQDGLVMSALGMGLLWITLTVCAISILLVSLRKELRQEVNETGQEYRAAVKERNFSKAWSIWKQAWGFSFNPRMSGGYATLNLAALMLAPISAATIIGGLLI